MHVLGKNTVLLMGALLLLGSGTVYGDGGKGKVVRTGGKAAVEKISTGATEAVTSKIWQGMVSKTSPLGREILSTQVVTKSMSVSMPKRMLEDLPVDGSATLDIPRKEAQAPLATGSVRELVAPLTAAQKELSAQETFAQKIAQKHPRIYLGYQEKIKGLTHRQALREQLKLTGSHLARHWPFPTATSVLAVDHLDGLLIERSLQKKIDTSTTEGLYMVAYLGATEVGESAPPFPIAYNGSRLFRGMSLDEAGLRNILENGIRREDIKKFGYRTNVLDLVIGKEKRQALVGDVDVPVWTTHYSSLAASHALGNSVEGKTPVVVTMIGYQGRLEAKDPNVKDNGGEWHHVKIYEDIPVDNILQVTALLKGPDGTPVWCKVSLALDGRLLIEPYESEVK